MKRDETDERAVRDARDARSTRSGTFTMEEFRLNKRGLGVSSQQRLDALTEGRGSEAASVSASASEGAVSLVVLSAQAARSVQRVVRRV